MKDMQTIAVPPETSIGDQPVNFSQVASETTVSSMALFLEEMHLSECTNSERVIPPLNTDDRKLGHLLYGFCVNPYLTDHRQTLLEVYRDNYRILATKNKIGYGGLEKALGLPIWPHMTVAPANHIYQ